MSSDAEPLLTAGERRLAEGDWAQARHAFASALELQHSAAALDGLGEAQLWLGETQEGVELREQAYAAYLRDGEGERAVDVALWLCRNHAANFGNDAAATGWLARARRLVEEHGLVSRHPQVLLHEAFAEADPTVGEELAREAYELGQARDDPDLQLCALSQFGAALIEQGRVAEGVRYLRRGHGWIAGRRRKPPRHRGVHQLHDHDLVHHLRGVRACRAVDPCHRPVRAALRQPVPVRRVPCAVRRGPDRHRRLGSGRGGARRRPRDLTPRHARPAPPGAGHPGRSAAEPGPSRGGRTARGRPRGSAGRGRCERQDPVAASACGDRRDDAASRSR